MKNKRSLFHSNKAVSSVIGSILIFSVTILCISVMFIYSVPVVMQMQDDAEVQQVEQAFTILDSRISKVALGESPVQKTTLSIMSGTINVNGAGRTDKGKMTIQLIDQINNTTEEFNCSLGTIEYVKDDRTIAYEGGGVWSDYGSEGGTVMVSPPEFHFNGVTLTLPIMTINGNSSSSGKGDIDIAVTSDSKPAILYPNTSASLSRTNPVVHDKVIVYIESNYYKAWADYANTLTQTHATVDDANKIAIVEFNTLPEMGTFTLENNIKLSQVDPSVADPIHAFDFRFEAASAQGLNPDKYDITATEGTKTITYSLQKSGGPNVLDLHVTYTDTSVGPDYIEHWDSVGQIPIDGSKSDEYSSVDLLSDSFMMKYNPPNLDGADTDFSWGPSGNTSELPDVEINTTAGYDQYSLNDITQHYIKLMTKDEAIVFYLDGGSQDPVDYGASMVSLNYDPYGNHIVYLHVTQNELDTYVIN